MWSMGCRYPNPLTVTIFSLTRSSQMSFYIPKMTKMKIVYKQLYCNTEWFISIVLATDKMFSLSKVIISIIEAISKYIDFIISSSTRFITMHELLDLFML